MQTRYFRHHAFMKRILFTATVFVVAFSGHAQSTSDKLYGFRQQVSPGITKAADIDESGRVTKRKTATSVQHAIFFTTASKTRIYPVQVWLNGEAFSVKAETLEHPPVTYSNSDAVITKPKLLFPQSAGTIYRLTPMPLLADKSNGKGKALAQANAVVLLYKKSGKMQYGVLKKFTDLEPASLQ